MKHPAASQAQRNRRIRSQEAMQRSHRRSELIRQTSEQENQALSPLLPEESTELAASPHRNEREVCSTVDGPHISLPMAWPG
jgi:hypothetical protein